MALVPSPTRSRRDPIGHRDVASDVRDDVRVNNNRRPSRVAVPHRAAQRLLGRARARRAARSQHVCRPSTPLPNPIACLLTSSRARRFRRTASLALPPPLDRPHSQVGAVAAPSILPRPDLAAVRASLAATAIGPAEFVAVGKAALAGLTVGWAYSGIKRDLDTPVARGPTTPPSGASTTPGPRSRSSSITGANTFISDTTPTRISREARARSSGAR